MRKYSLTAQGLMEAQLRVDNAQQMVWDWVKEENGPAANTIVAIDLYPTKKIAVYHLATGIDEEKMEIKTTLFSMPIKHAPRWVDLCEMSEV